MKILSSYARNNYGDIFQKLIVDLQPKLIVELGILYGYSTIYIAKAIKNFDTKFDAYDLFEKYKYKHGSREEVQRLIDKENLTDFVNIRYGDAFKVNKLYKDKSVDFLHVDISNTGDVLKKIIDLWSSKLTNKGIIAFEGGSEERDNIYWMKKYHCSSIKKELETNEVIKKYYSYTTLQKFPSLTILKKK